MYIPKNFESPNPVKIQRGQQEHLRKKVANLLHQQIVKRDLDGNRLLNAMVDWYQSIDDQTRDIVLDQIIKLMDLLGERADLRHINRNFGPLSALELLGAALAVDHGWFSKEDVCNGL